MLYATRNRPNRGAIKAPSAGGLAVAAFVALSLHAGAVYLLVSDEKDGAISGGIGGMEISVSMVAARTGRELEAEAQDAQTPEPATTQAQVPEAPAPEPPVSETTTPADAVATLPNIRPIPSAIPRAAPLLSAPVAEAALAVPAPPELVTADPVQIAPRPKRKPPPPRKTSSTEKPVKANPEKAAPVPASDSIPRSAPDMTAGKRQQASEAAMKASGQSRSDTATKASDAVTAMGGGAVGRPSNDYMHRLRYWLGRHKTYPEEARRRRMQGVAHLYFRVTRDGRVLEHSIRKSSGFPLLDGEAEAMLRRAQPLPKFGDGMKGGYLDVVVPVSFALRGNN